MHSFNDHGGLYRELEFIALGSSYGAMVTLYGLYIEEHYFFIIMNSWPLDIRIPNWVHSNYDHGDFQSWENYPPGLIRPLVRVLELVLLNLFSIWIFSSFLDIKQSTDCIVMIESRVFTKFVKFIVAVFIGVWWQGGNEWNTSLIKTKDPWFSLLNLKCLAEERSLLRCTL